MRYASLERHRIGGHGALGGMVFDAVDGCAGDGVPGAGGLEAGAGELVAGWLEAALMLCRDALNNKSVDKSEKTVVK